MSEEDSGEDSDLEYHTPLPTRTRDLISRSSVSRAIDSSSYIERTLYTRVQSPVSVSRADESSAAHPVGSPPAHITKISPSEDVVIDELFNDRSFDEINNLDELLQSGISGVNNTSQFADRSRSPSLVEEAIDVLCEEAGLIPTEPTMDMAALECSRSLDGDSSPRILDGPSSPRPSSLRLGHTTDTQKSVQIANVCGAGNPTVDDAVPSTSSAAPGGPSPSSVSPDDVLQADAGPGCTLAADIQSHCHLEVPIVGYEIMEQRARFTVFKIQVKRSDQAWYIFRRYSDFWRLNEQLRQEFCHFRLSLPPKRYFGNNFDINFLDSRLHGLQAFLNNIVGHVHVFNSDFVQSFFCLNDPPGPYDSLEESMAQCDILEDQVYDLRKEVQEKDGQIALLHEELNLKSTEIENLRRSLRIERSLNSDRRSSPLSTHSECSLPEHEQTTCEDKAQGISDLDLTWDSPLLDKAQKLKLHHDQSPMQYSTPRKPTTQTSKSNRLENTNTLNQSDTSDKHISEAQTTLESTNDISSISEVTNHMSGSPVPSNQDTDSSFLSTNESADEMHHQQISSIENLHNNDIDGGLCDLSVTEVISCEKTERVTPLPIATT